MEVVIIPFEYENLSPAEQTAIIPICIKSTDEAGNPIDPGWFEAVARVQDPLRTLAKFWLDDVWRVSEITEAAVHALWSRHGRRLGRERAAGFTLPPNGRRETGAQAVGTVAGEF